MTLLVCVSMYVCMYVCVYLYVYVRTVCVLNPQVSKLNLCVASLLEVISSLLCFVVIELDLTRPVDSIIMDYILLLLFDNHSIA